MSLLCCAPQEHAQAIREAAGAQAHAGSCRDTCFLTWRQESHRRALASLGDREHGYIPFPGDQLLQVDGVSLCGLTHKQAVQRLQGPGQVSTLLPGTFSYFQSFLKQPQKLQLPLGRNEVAKKQGASFLVYLPPFPLFILTLLFCENVKPRR